MRPSGQNQNTFSTFDPHLETAVCVFEVARELRENEPTTNMYEMFKIPLFCCENSFNAFECTEWWVYEAKRVLVSV